MMDKQKLEEKKNALVGELNKINQKIEDYGLLDIAYDNGPFRDFILERERIIRKIDEVKRDLDNN